MLLIAGLGLDGNSRWRSIPGFAEQFRVITFDYRGVGRSGRAPTFCSTDDLADDAVAVLDEAGVACSLVYGFSLGGRSHSTWLFVTQTASARSYRGPRRRAGLTRCCHRRQRSRISGGPGSSPARPPPRPPSPHVYGDRCRRETPERIAADLEQRHQRRVDPHASGTRRRGNDARRPPQPPRHRRPHTGRRRRHDRLIPKANGKLIARTIPDARLHLIPHAGHYYRTDEPSVDGFIASRRLGTAAFRDLTHEQ